MVVVGPLIYIAKSQEPAQEEKPKVKLLQRYDNRRNRPARAAGMMEPLASLKNLTAQNLTARCLSHSIGGISLSS
jgi:hypothetical protein